MREKLTEALKRFTVICKSGSAPRPGSNLLPMLYLCTDDESVEVTGDEMEALYRAGLLDVEPDPDVRQVADSEAYGGIDADFRWFVTPAGRAALLAQTEASDGR